jgi:hypothetical protein
MKLTDIFLIIVVSLIVLLILISLIFYTYGKYNLNILNALNIIILLGLAYLVFLQNNEIKDLDNNVDIENINKYLTILSPLITMVDSDGNPIVYP